jgi:uncharacterized protein (DUF4415 family)
VESDDSKRYSRAEIAEMKKRGETRATPFNAPEIELDDEFWNRARIVASRPRRASVHLRIDPDTIAFFRSAGRGHLTRMADVLRIYAETQSKR